MQAPASTVDTTLRRLGTVSKIQVGAVYSSSGRLDIKELGNLATARVLNDITGAAMNSVAASPAIPAGTAVLKGACTPALGWRGIFGIQHCEEPIKISVRLQPTQLFSSSLEDPFLFLEMLNRPVSGLYYNRDSEIRIMQWRTALAGASSNKLFLCTGFQYISGGALIVRGRMDPPDAVKIAAAIAQDADFDIEYDNPKIDRTSHIIEVSFAVKQPLMVAAHFREIALISTSTFPRVDFTLGQIRSVSIAGE